MAHLGIRKESRLGYDDALAQLPELLRSEGFGVLTQIDVKETLRARIGVDFRRYMILGACNPHLAHRALSTAIDLGVLLPCNVVVYEGDAGKAVVVAVDPMQTIAAQLPELAPVAAEVRAKLARVLERLP